MKKYILSKIYVIIFVTLIFSVDFVDSKFSVEYYKENKIDGIYSNNPNLNNGAITSYSFMQADNDKKFEDIDNFIQKKRRKTMDGRACSKQFAQDGKTYFDCTKARTPDGELSSREWCYVDSTYKSGKKWDYCIPIMDYDRVRAASNNSLKDLTKTSTSINSQISMNITPAQRSLDLLNKVKSFQDDLQNKINELNKLINVINQNIFKLIKAKQDGDKQDKIVNDLNLTIEQKMSEQKLRKEEEDKNILLARKTNDCRGMLLYEDDERGDGLIGHYYDNEFWLGSYNERTDKFINFDWTDASPINSINPNNFSVQWKGWVFIPATSNYKFSIETDGGVELSIDGETIISYRLGSLINAFVEGTERKEPQNKDNSEEANKKINPNKIDSEKIYLVGGTLRKIKLRYYHSVHTSIFSDDQVFIKLLWSNEEIEEVPITTRYLYSSFSFAPLKITGYNSNENQLRKLHENDFAFLNSDKFILQDIPPKFLNAFVLKFKTRYQSDLIAIKSNSPTFVYVAFLSHYPNPLPGIYTDTGLTMSLVQVDKMEQKGTKRFQAKKSAQMKIYKKKFNKGFIQIKLKKLGLNKHGIPLLVFFGFDGSQKSPLKCAGKLINISQSTSPYFKGCSASSEKPGYKCEDGFSGKNRDEEGGMWAANSDGVGAYIRVKFVRIFEITKFVYRNRKNPSERNASLELFFDSGDTYTVNLKNNDEIFEVDINSVRTNGVKVMIKSVYGTLNNGGSFNFWGLECETKDLPLDPLSENENVPTLFDMNRRKPVNLSCYDSLSNSSKFEIFEVKEDFKTAVRCPESCALIEQNIYGDLFYSYDTPICKAAYHAGKLITVGGLVNMVVGPFQTNLKGAFRNGIKSFGKEMTKFTVSFEAYEEEDVIILKSGSKVDLKIDNGSESKWVPGMISQVLDNANGRFLRLILDGENSKSFDWKYPDKERVQPCGEHVKNRECKNSVKKLKEINPILIRFVPEGYNSADDFLSDFGQVIGQNNKPFGWSIDMRKNIKQRKNPSKPVLETLVEFPPPANSRACNKPNPLTHCEPVTWKVKVGQGKFKIKIYIGDPEKDSRVNIKINNKYIAYNKFVARNTQEIFEDVMFSREKMFEISADCVEDCENARTRINAIELIPFEGNNKSSKDKKPQKVVPCGMGLLGGECESGPNVLHCLFSSPSVPSAQFCNGDKSLVSIKNGDRCPDQVGKYKCVKKAYNDENDCKKFCPKTCQLTKCIY